jgi:hypothetical protein
MSASRGPVDRIHHLLLRAYPPEYIETFGDEMQNTFIEGLNDAREHGVPGLFILREIRDLPKSLLNAYWYGWKRKLLGGIRTVQRVMSSSDLPPAPPDGRESWRQAFFEVSMFFSAGLLLILATYVQYDGLPAGWQRNVGFMGRMIVPLTAPFLLLGLARGLPRWAYPLGGLMLGYYGLVSGQTSLWLSLIVMLFAACILALAAIVTDPQPSLLPVPIRRMGQSLSVDWTRLSFGLFGAMPLIILMAFDDAHTNSRTPYFALSVMGMVISALIYCRSREVRMQIAALLAGLTLSIWGAWLDKIYFAGSLMNWSTVTASGNGAPAWIIVLWVQWALLILSPAVLILFHRVVHVKRAV